MSVAKIGLFLLQVYFYCLMAALNGKAVVKIGMQIYITHN